MESWRIYGWPRSPRSPPDTGFWEVGDVTLVALRPGASAEVLLDPPDEVVALDVARNLLAADRFGGPAPEG